MTLEERFWAKVKRGSPEECWEWQAYKNALGYGSMLKQRKNWLAHRLSWLIHHGPIPEAFCVLHTCDNPPCVNPIHLWLGTKADNSEDKRRKGRTQRLFGEANGRVKLTTEKVLRLRALRAEGYSFKQLATLFEIPKSTLHHAISGRTWLHVVDT